MNVKSLLTLTLTLVTTGCATTSGNFNYHKSPPVIDSRLNDKGDLTSIEPIEGETLACFKDYRPTAESGVVIEIGVPPQVDKSDKGKGTQNLGGPIVGQAFQSYVVEGLMDTRFPDSVHDMTDGNWLGLAKHVNPDIKNFYVPEFVVEGVIPDVGVHGGWGGEVGNSGVYIYRGQQGFVMFYSYQIVHTLNGKRSVIYKDTIGQTVASTINGIEFDGLINDNLSRIELTEKTYPFIADAMHQVAEIAASNIASFFTGENCYTGRPVEAPLNFHAILGRAKIEGALEKAKSNIMRRSNEISTLNTRYADLLREKRLLVAAIKSGADSIEMKSLIENSQNEKGVRNLPSPEAVQHRLEEVQKILKEIESERKSLKDSRMIPNLEAQISKYQVILDKLSYHGKAKREYPIIAESLGIDLEAKRKARQEKLKAREEAKKAVAQAKQLHSDD